MTLPGGPGLKGGTLNSGRRDDVRRARQAAVQRRLAPVPSRIDAALTALTLGFAGRRRGREMHGFNPLSLRAHPLVVDEKTKAAPAASCRSRTVRRSSPIS